MKFHEFIGQQHLFPLNQMLLTVRPKLILVTGPPGTGKTSYARTLSEALGGTWTATRWILDELDGDGTIIDQADPRWDDWSRLIELLEVQKNHIVIYITNDLDQIPRAIQSRSVRVHLRPVSESDLRGFLEGQLVTTKTPYTPEVIDQILQHSGLDFRRACSLMELYKSGGSFEDLPLDGNQVGLQIYDYLVEGNLQDAIPLANEYCQQDGARDLACNLLRIYAQAWVGQKPLQARIRLRFPSQTKTSEALLRWTSPSVPSGEPLGNLVLEALNSSGIRVESKSVKDSILSDSAKGINSSMGDAPRANPGVPVWEDTRIPMDPRVREQLKQEALAVAKTLLKDQHRIPSSVLAEGSICDSNPYGVRLPPPNQIPKGALLGSQFAKLARAKRLSPEQKWDQVYKEREYNSNLLAELAAKVQEKGGKSIEQGKTLLVRVGDFDLNELEFPYDEV